jgi:hypothetical protein
VRCASLAGMLDALMNLRYRNEHSYKTYLNFDRGQLKLESPEKHIYLIRRWCWDRNGPMLQQFSTKHCKIAL